MFSPPPPCLAQLLGAMKCSGCGRPRRALHNGLCPDCKFDAYLGTHDWFDQLKREAGPNPGPHCRHGLSVLFGDCYKCECEYQAWVGTDDWFDQMEREGEEEARLEAPFLEPCRPSDGLYASLFGRLQ